MVPCDRSTRLYISLRNSINTIMKQVCNDPVIYSTIIKDILPPNFKEEIISMWNTQQPWKNYTTNFNIELQDYEKRLDPLYNIFCNKLKETFDLQLTEQRKYWLYINDNEWQQTYWHNHKTTATIVGVYYIEAPSDGPIEFENVNKDEVYTYYPKEFELLFFSSSLVHRPIPSSSLRISMNLETFADRDPFV